MWKEKGWEIIVENSHDSILNKNSSSNLKFNMWIIIIVLLISITVFLSFNSDRNAQIKKIDSEGGMRKKYSELISYLCGNKGNILRQSGSSITIGASSIGGSTIFILTQTFGTINIKWQVNSPVFGTHSLVWEFSEHEQQIKMIHKIENDILYYNSKFNI